jgi:hypothetical protein
MSERIQRKRKKGWRMPQGAVYVGRPSRWGNPFRVGDPIGDTPRSIVSEAGYEHCSPDDEIRGMMAVDLYRVWIGRRIMENPHHYNLNLLRGKQLVCWCAIGEPCHADVLLEACRSQPGCTRAIGGGS